MLLTTLKLRALPVEREREKYVATILLLKIPLLLTYYPFILFYYVFDYFIISRTLLMKLPVIVL